MQQELRDFVEHFKSINQSQSVAKMKGQFYHNRRTLLRQAQVAGIPKLNVIFKPNSSSPNFELPFCCINFNCILLKFGVGFVNHYNPTGNWLDGVVVMCGSHGFLDGSNNYLWMLHTEVLLAAIAAEKMKGSLSNTLPFIKIDNKRS
jgi:hypothetical protein